VAVVAAAALVLVGAACQDGASITSVERQREVAREYVIATVEKRDAIAAARLSPNRRAQITFEIEMWRRLVIDHVLDGPIPCPEDLLDPVSEPCFAFKVEGDPNPASNGLASVHHGTLSVGVTAAGDQPIVVDTGYMGGFRLVDNP
jgi:hypothetical protein